MTTLNLLELAQRQWQADIAGGTLASEQHTQTDEVLRDAAVSADEYLLAYRIAQLGVDPSNPNYIELLTTWHQQH